METESGEQEHEAVACKPSQSTAGRHRKNKGGWEITAPRPNIERSYAT